jgi:ABC-type Fe3+ transport system substrate-binding protein/WD40 repeat protein
MLLAAGEPPSQPILRVETGMHTATIRCLAVDGGGATAITASDDKTLRVWDPANGNLLNILRPPIGPFAEGRLYACALSPDGTLAAAGGSTGHAWDGSGSVYVFDRASGRMVKRLTGCQETINRLVFSRDGQRLAMVSRAGGMRIVQVSDWKELARDEAYGASSHGADFDRTGRLVTCCYDGCLRLYDGTGALLCMVRVGGLPHSVRFSPDGTKVAVGYGWQAKIEVLSGQDLSLVTTPSLSGIPYDQDLRTVAWSPDGQRLYAAGIFPGMTPGGGRNCIYAWTQAGAGPRQDWPVTHNAILDLAPLPDGRVAWVSADPGWGIQGGASRFSRQFDFREDLTTFSLDGTANQVAFGREQFGGTPACFNVYSRLLTFAAIQGLRVPRTSAPGAVVTDWHNGTDPKLNGRTLALDGGEWSRSAVLASNGNVLLGADWNLYSFDRQGVRRWKRSTPGTTWCVNLSADGRLGAAAFGDGIIRWYRMDDGRELLSLFVHQDGKRWVAWTPPGYYDCSPGGEDLFGWHVNRGKEMAADFFPASGGSAARFRSQFHCPEVVSRALILDESSTPAYDDAFGQLVRAAQAEGGLAVLGLNQSIANYRVIFDTFSARYGVPVFLVYPAAISSDQEQVLRDSMGGEGCPVMGPDVVEVDPSLCPVLKAEGLSAPYQVRTWDSIPGVLKDPDGYWSGGYYALLVLEVNTGGIGVVPRDWGDLLGPDFQGVVALTGDPVRGRASGIAAVAAASKAMTGNLADPWAGLLYFRRLNEAGRLMPHLGSWRTLDFEGNSVQAWWDFNAVLNQEFNGPATTTVLPASGVVAGVFVQGISAFAPHPNAARLFEEFLLSDEGQLLLLEGHAHPARLDDLVQRAVVSDQQLANLLAVPPEVEICFPTPEELQAVRAVCAEQWENIVGVHFAYR